MSPPRRGHPPQSSNTTAPRRPPGRDAWPDMTRSTHVLGTGAGKSPGHRRPDTVVLVGTLHGRPRPPWDGPTSEPSHSPRSNLRCQAAWHEHWAIPDDLDWPPPRPAPPPANQPARRCLGPLRRTCTRNGLIIGAVGIVDQPRLPERSETSRKSTNQRQERLMTAPHPHSAAADDVRLVRDTCSSRSKRRGGRIVGGVSGREADPARSRFDPGRRRGRRKFTLRRLSTSIRRGCGHAVSACGMLPRLHALLAGERLFEDPPRVTRAAGAPQPDPIPCRRGRSGRERRPAGAVAMEACGPGIVDARVTGRRPR